MSGGHRLYEAWIDLYQRSWDDPSSVPGQTCPNCRSRMLRLLFVVDSIEAEAGTAVFWCASCLTGLMPLRAPVPHGGVQALRGTEEIPNYELVVDE